MKIFILVLMVLVVFLGGGIRVYGQEGIKVYAANPAYWEYKGQPVVLIGGSDDDNLFQWKRSDLKDQLDLLQSIGGNYVRCVISCRDNKGFEVWPYQKTGNLYDLDQWNPTFWDRFSDFLSLTYGRDIIVQIELWATWDFYSSGQHWNKNPYNPKNNSNYTSGKSGLPEKINFEPWQTNYPVKYHPFFWTVPKEKNNAVVLPYQEKFVKKLLSYSLQYPHVLYCMDNETSVTPEWGWYWSAFIKAEAAKQGVIVHTTEMWDKWELSDSQHDATFNHPEIYSFVDISQNNHQLNQTHWDNMQKQRNRISAKMRPLNNTKIYGANGSSLGGNNNDAFEKFWRNIFGGCASSRFHRPNSGLGLTAPAQPHIKSMRMLLDTMDNFFKCEPHNDLLSSRSSDEAYCIANPQKEAAVFFTTKGKVVLDVSQMTGKSITVTWLDISNTKWLEPQSFEKTNSLTLTTPLSSLQVVLVKSASPTAIPLSRTSR